MGKHRLQNSIWPRALQVFRQASARHNVCMDPQPLAPEDADQWLEAVVEPLPQLNEMLEVLRRRCGIDFSGYKTTTLTRRARQRMARLSVLRPEDYLEMLQEQGGEREALSSELLVNVTEFFRDTEVFRQLEEQVLPDLLRGRDAGDDLRIWCAGCASGEEAYSVTMLALEAAGRLGFHGNVKVFATDLAPQALAKASRGSYEGECLAAVPEGLRRRYLQGDSTGGMRADATLRRHLVFARHNLLNDPPFTSIDLALCRNLLIYLKPEAQFKALSQLHFALKPQGLLLLGASENVAAFESNACLQWWTAATSCTASSRPCWPAPQFDGNPWAIRQCRPCRPTSACSHPSRNKGRRGLAAELTPRASACMKWCWNCKAAMSASTLQRGAHGVQ